MVRLEKITQKIIDDANEKARMIIEEAQAKCDEINLECERRLSAIQDSMYADALGKGEHIKSKSMSEVAMNKRDIMLSMKNRLVDEVFLSAIKEIVELDAERYRELMTQLLCRVLSEQIESEKDSMRLYGENISPDKYEVIMNKRDKEAHGQYIVAGVRRATVGKIGGYILDKVFLSNSTADIEGGIILKCGDIEINASFESIASELRGELEGEVMATLFPLSDDSAEDKLSEDELSGEEIFGEEPAEGGFTEDEFSGNEEEYAEDDEYVDSDPEDLSEQIEDSEYQEDEPEEESEESSDGESFDTKDGPD